MPRVVERLFRPLPDRWLHSAGRWINLVVVPVLLIGAGTYRLYATATTPFEEFLGTLVVVNTALLWGLCFGLLAHLWRRPTDPE